MSDIDSLLDHFEHSRALLRENKMGVCIRGVGVCDFDGFEAEEDNDHPTIINKC